MRTVILVMGLLALQLPIAAQDKTDKKEELFGSHDGKKVTTVVFNKDGSLLASAGEDDVLRVWDIKKAKLVNKLSGPKLKDVRCLAFTPDNRLVFGCGKESGVIAVWNREDSKLHVLWEEKLRVTAVALMPDGKTLVSADTEGTLLRKWNLDDYTFVHGYSARGMKGDKLTTLSAYAFAGFSSDGNVMFHGGAGYVGAYNVKTKKAQLFTTEEKGSLLSLAVHPTRSLIAYSIGKKIIMWDLEKMENNSRIVEVPGTCSSVRFTPDGQQLYALSGNELINMPSILLNDKKKLNQTMEAAYIAKNVRAFAFHPSSKKIALATDDGVKMLDLESLD